MLRTMTSRKAPFLAMIFATTALVSGLQIAHAEDSLGTKTENAAEDVKKDTKKTVRKAKKAGRDATGNDSWTKDMKDKGADAKDDVKAEANKAENKLKD